MNPAPGARPSGPSPSSTERAAAAPVAGAVLAGGQSRRMGRDKALLPYGAGTLLEHALAQVAPLVTQLLVATGAEARYGEQLRSRGATAVLDRPEYGPGAGPLVGLEALLDAAQAGGAGRLIVLACDLPHVRTNHLAALLAASHGADVAIGCDPGGDQPLVGVYDVVCLPALRGALARGERRVDSFFGGTGPGGRPLSVLRLDAEALAPGAATSLFHNLNGPEDVVHCPAPKLAPLR